MPVLPAVVVVVVTRCAGGCFAVASRVAGVGERKAAVAGDGDISSSSETAVSNSSSKAGFF